MEKEEHLDDEIDEVAIDSVKDTESIGYDKEDIEDIEDSEEIEDNETTVSLQNSEKNEDYHNTSYYNLITIVPDNERVTSDIMTKFEWSEVIGIRTCHIENNGVIYTDIGTLTDPRMIAIKELQDRKSPLMIVRKVGDNKVEHWKCNEMGFPVDVDNVY
jgi:DNA-directed RNA polymerase subunit K/omega